MIESGPGSYSGYYFDILFTSILIQLLVIGEPLALGINLSAGRVNITVPNVHNGSNYQILRKSLELEI